MVVIKCILQEKLTEELREAMKKSRKESELNTVDSQIRGLETRLRFAKTDMDGTVSGHDIFNEFQRYLRVLYILIHIIDH